MARVGGATRKSARGVPFVLCLLLGALAIGAAAVASRSSSSTPTSSVGAAVTPGAANVSAANPSISTSTTAPPSTTTPLPVAAGFVAGRVTAVGDSVMLDYQDPLQTDIPGVSVDASVSRQWSQGESIFRELKASGQLGSEVIVALGTNGPISDADFDTMMEILAGASRVVFVNVHVDRPWQDPNNATIAAGAARYPLVEISAMV